MNEAWSLVPSIRGREREKGREMGEEGRERWRQAGVWEWRWVGVTSDMPLKSTNSPIFLEALTDLTPSSHAYYEAPDDSRAGI